MLINLVLNVLELHVKPCQVLDAIPHSLEHLLLLFNLKLFLILDVVQRIHVGFDLVDCVFNVTNF